MIRVPVLVAALASCTGQEQGVAPIEQASFAVVANLTGTSAVAVVVNVTAPDIATPLVFDIPIVNSVASGTVTVPAGSSRTITVHAYDAGGVETHGGSNTVNITPGNNPTMTINLMPLTGGLPVIATIGSYVVTVAPGAATLTLPTGSTIQVTASILDALARPVSGSVTWATRDPGVAIVDATGFVTAIGVGTTWIAAVYEGVAGASLITVATHPIIWPNEPAGFTAVPELTFSTAISNTGNYEWENGWRVDNWRSPPRVLRASDVTAPLTPLYVGQFMYFQGMHGGSEPGTVYLDARGAKDHYVGYWFKYSNPYSNQAVGTKQWFPASATSRYFILYSSSGQIQLVVQADGAHGSAYDLSGNINSPTITLGVWHRMEVYQKYPTNSASPDGIFRWWIDGVLCGNYTNITWNTSSTYEEWRLGPTWGGLEGSVGFDSYWWVDHLHVSTP